MKLLSIIKNREAKQESDVIKRLRSKEIDEEYNRKLQLLNTLNDDFDKALKSQKDTYATEKEAHLAWRHTEDEEVKKLEDRRTHALLPIEEREKAVEDRERKVSEVELQQMNTKVEYNDLMLLLQTRLTEATEIKSQNTQTSIAFGLQKQGIDRQSESVKEQAQQLSSAMSSFMLKSKQRESELVSRETVCQLKESGFEMREARNTMKEKELKLLEVGLKDRYAQLEKTQKEILANQKL